jgi:hypothetical protein
MPCLKHNIGTAKAVENHTKKTKKIRFVALQQRKALFLRAPAAVPLEGVNFPPNF